MKVHMYVSRKKDANKKKEGERGGVGVGKSLTRFTRLCFRFTISSKGFSVGQVQHIIDLVSALG